MIDGLRASTSTVKHKLAYVIQHDRLLPNLTVLETLLFVAKLAYPNYKGAELQNKVKLQQIYWYLRSFASFNNILLVLLSYYV